MNFRTVFTAASFLLVMVLSSTAHGNEPPKVTVDGLRLVNDTTMARVYAKPDVDLSQYNRIYLVKPTVAFRKNWLSGQNSLPNRRVTQEDMQRIKAELADLFVDVFKLELQNNGGYVLVDGVAEDVLIVRPAIVDLDVFAPDTPGTRGQRSAIASAGTMSLYMELMDSVTGDMLVKAFDNKYDRTRTFVQARDKTRNEYAARNMLGEWAELLRMALDEARVKVTSN